MTSGDITRIPLEGIHNCRDLGGLHTADGRSIQPFRLIRSCELNETTDKDRQLLTGHYQLKNVVDFRTGAECVQVPDPKFPGVNYFHIPVLKESTMGITREKEKSEAVWDEMNTRIVNGEASAEEYMADMYRNIVMDDHAQQTYTQFFDTLLSENEGATLYHCSAGKDRAGVGTVLLLLALGMDYEVIRADYLAANRFLQDNIKRNLDHAAKRYGSYDKALRLKALFSVTEENLTATFDIMKERYGSSEAYLEQAVGVTKEKRIDLQKLYTI